MIIKLILASAFLLVIFSSAESNRRQHGEWKDDGQESSSSASASASREFGRKSDMQRRRHGWELGPQSRSNWGWRKHFLMNKDFQGIGHHRRRHHRRHHRRPWRRHHRRHGRHGRRCHHCPKWQKWEESTCLWPGSGKPQIPESCHVNLTDRLPAPVAAYYKEKAREAAEVIQALFKERGLTQACGFCSRKIACRQRKQKHHSKKRRGCRPVEFAFVNEECEGSDACQISVVNGGCPAPFPQGKLIKYNRLIAKKFRKHRHHGPFEFHGHRFGFEQARHKWHDEDHDSDESSSEETSAGRSNSNSAENSAEKSSTPSSSESSSSSAESSSVEKSSSAENQNNTSASTESANKSSSSSKSSESSSKSSSASGEGRRRRHGGRHGLRNNKKRRYSPFIPLWHCVKNKDGDKCLCCCGGYFPDVNTGKCVPVKNGNRFPPAVMGFGKP